MVVSLFLAFFTVQAYSEFAVRGFDAQLRVDSLGTTASSAEAYGTIATFATSRDCTVAKVTFDLTDVSTRHLSVLGDGSADPGGRWLDHGVADFSRGVTTQVHPGAELGATSPVGSYGLSCGTAEAEALAAALREAGVTASADSYPTILSWHRYLAGTPIPAGYAIAAVAVVLLAGCGALLNARAYAVQRLQGAPFSSILRRDLAPIGRRLALHLGGAAVVCAIVLGAYNGFAQATTFLGLAGAVLAGLLLVTVTAHAVSTAAAQRIPLAAAIKGESVGAWVVPPRSACGSAPSSSSSRRSSPPCTRASSSRASRPPAPPGRARAARPPWASAATTRPARASSRSASARSSCGRSTTARRCSPRGSPSRRSAR
ncbi:hypothetical protein IU11_07460 [Cellulosimicrobium sp. MM]|nr:hypothetical protein IU11_07460 [Cellulosimicrobium sp. MM]